MTAWLGLLLHEGLQRVLAEPARGEDATLEQCDGVVVEVQVKTEADPNLDAFASWLLNYPKGASTGCLLERLASDPARHALFVLADRVPDALAPLGTRPAKAPVPSWRGGRLSQEATRDLRSSLLAYQPSASPTALDKARIADTARLVGQLGLRELRALTARIRLLGDHDDQRVRSEGTDRLVRDWRVAPSKAAALFDPGLRVCVEEAATAGDDVLARLRTAIQPLRLDRLFRGAPHRPRAEESTFVAWLERDPLLLLTGPPLAGKTRIAERVGQVFQDRGWVCQRFVAIADACRFLLDTAPEDRLALVEDPFGRFVGDPGEPTTALKGLGEVVRPGRLAIVTSRSDVGAGLPSLPRRPWHDLEVNDAAVAESIWEVVAEPLDPAIRREVMTRLDGPCLQPGQMDHLVRELRARTGGGLPSKDTLRELACFDADELGDVWRADPAFQPTVAALALLAAPEAGPTEAEIGFVASDLPSEPGRRPERLSVSDTFPTLPAVALPPAVTAVLGQMERRGFVAWVGAEVRFTHPLYLQAARRSLLWNDRYARARTAAQVNRAVFLLRSPPARNALDGVAWLRERASEHAGLVEAWFAACKSILPGVVDRAVEHLVRAYPNLDERLRQRVIEVIGGLQQGAIRWHEEEPWLAGTDGEDLLARRTDRLVGHRTAPTVEELWRWLSGEAKGVGRQDLEAGLRQPYAALRRQAAKHALRYGDAALIDLGLAALKDDHPLAFLGAVHGFLLGYRHLEPAKRERLLACTIARLSSPCTSLLVMNLLCDIRQAAGWNPDWYEGRTLPYEAWATLAGAVLVSVPAEERFNLPRFYTVAKEAFPRIDGDAALRLFAAWIGWIGRVLRVQVPDDYALGFAEFYPNLPRIARLPLLRELLAVEDSNLRCFVLMDLVRRWQKLDLEEQALLRAEILAPRSDRRWVQAVVLLTTMPPAEVLEDLGEDSVAYGITGPRVADTFAVWCDRSGLFSFLGAARRDTDRWLPALLAAARDCAHPCHALAVGELLYSMARQPATVAVWRELLSGATPERRTSLGGQLLAALLTRTYEPVDEVVRVFVDTASAEELEDFMGQLAANIELIEYTDHLEDLASVEARLFHHHLKADRIALEVLRHAEQVPQAADLVRALIEHAPPRLVSVYDYLLQAFRSDIALHEELTARRLELLEIGHEGRERRLEPARSTRPEGWQELCLRQKGSPPP